MTDEKPIPNFTAMPFEELMTTDSKPDNAKFNEALWSEQSKRYKKLNIAQLDEFNDVDKYQDEIADRLNKLELKLAALITFLQTRFNIEIPQKSQTLNEFLEDKIK